MAYFKQYFLGGKEFCKDEDLFLEINFLKSRILVNFVLQTNVKTSLRDLFQCENFAHHDFLTYLKIFSFSRFLLLPYRLEKGTSFFIPESRHRR